MKLFKKIFKKLSTDHQPDASQLHITPNNDSPIFYQDLEAYSIAFHNAAKEKFIFELTGTYLHKPNRCSSSGYGSDDWFFLCKFQNKDCILWFSNDAGYGTIWECAVISEEDARLLPTKSPSEWSAALRNSAEKHPRLHPDSIACAKKIIRSNVSRTGVITDEQFYGQY